VGSTPLNALILDAVSTAYHLLSYDSQKEIQRFKDFLELLDELKTKRS